MKFSFKGVTGAVTLLAAALGLSLAGPHRAYAAPGALTVPGDSDLGVTLLSPDPHIPLSGLKPVEISAFYQGSPANQIVAVELYLDGQRAATKTLDVPETRGVVSFLVDASQIKAGMHRIVVRATAADQEVKSAKGSFLFGGSEGSAPLSAPTPSDLSSRLPSSGLSVPDGVGGLAPTLHLMAPTESGKVQGMVTIKVQASDPSGKAPYVSLFIDKTFKTLRNFAPYEFEWDTTTYSNGYHTIEAFGYNDSAGVGHAPAMRLYVNNPGGETSIRHDLLDGVKSPARVSKKSQGKRLGRPLPLRRPDLLTAAEPVAPAGAAPRIASALPAHLLSTREVVRQLVRGANSLHFGAPAFETELSTPFAHDTPASAKPAPASGYKLMPAVAATPDPSAAVLAETLNTSAKRVSGKVARLQRLASRGKTEMRLPDSDLVSPFLTAPHPKPITVMSLKAAAYGGRLLRVHLPANLGSLLRSVGQTTVLFDHTTVKLDRPLSAQNSVLFGPLRQIFEQGGGSLTWQSHTGTVHARNATKDILLTIGNTQAVVNAKAVTLDGKPYLLLGRTMVPLSFVTAAMDADVQYDAATGHLVITSRK